MMTDFLQVQCLLCKVWGSWLGCRWQGLVGERAVYPRDPNSSKVQVHFGLESPTQVLFIDLDPQSYR